MKEYRIVRTTADIEDIRSRGDHTDSRKAAWYAIGKGSEIIAEIQQLSRKEKNWTCINDALPCLNPQARDILRMRSEAIARLKQAPHHRHGFRLSRYAGARYPRPVNCLCLISGHEGQEIPGLVCHDRVVVDAEHMEQALGPATVAEIFEIRKSIGEYVYISTNVSESPQIVRDMRTGIINTRSTAALSASKITAAIDAGADVVKVGFAHMDEFKRDIRSEEAVRQMKIIRKEVDRAVEKGAIVTPLNRTTRYPLVSVFFPEIGIDSHGERPWDIASKGIELTAKGGWQCMLIDTFEKHTGRKYSDYFTLEQTAKLAKLAHENRIELWIAGSISLAEIEPLIGCKVDLICFGGAARHGSAQRSKLVDGRQDQTIKRPLVAELVNKFEGGPALIAREGKSVCPRYQ